MLASLMTRRLIAEAALLAAIGLFMAIIGAYGTVIFPIEARLAYWLLSLVGGGLIGIAVDRALRRAVPHDWHRVLAGSALATPATSALVMALGVLLIGGGFEVSIYLQLLWQVFLVLLAVMTLRVLVWRRLPPIVETRTIVETRMVAAPPLPEAEAAFRRRLSAKRRSARLIAIAAEDHYVRAYTDAGDELLTVRFADALAELERAHGFRLHRSWWAAGDAIERVQWRRGGGEAELSGGLHAPVSRTYARALKDAGWF